MNFNKTTLPSGLRVLTIPMSGAESVTVTVWANVGSRYEEEQVAGISHFTEHIVFKGSKKYPTTKDLSSFVDSFGGEFNAGTTKEWTNFYIKSSKNHLEKAFDVLSDMILNPLIDKDELEKEKGVILEEKAMYEDTPTSDIGDVFEELIFQGNPLGRNIVGTEKAIKNITRNDFIEFRKKYYFPENLLITVAGGVTEKEAIDLVNKYFINLPENEPKENFPKFVAKQNEPWVKLKYKKIEQAHLILGFRGFKLGDQTRFAENILATILGKGMSSRLFIEVREKRGLAYSVHTSADHLIDTGYFSTYVGVDPKNAEEAIKIILEEHYAIKDKVKLIEVSEFQKAKEYLKGHIALSLEDTSAVNQFFGEKELLIESPQTPEEIFESLDKVTIDQVYDVAKQIFLKQNLNLSIIGPYNGEDKFKKILV